MQDKKSVSVCIIDYGMGNLRSVYRKVCESSSDVIVSTEKEDILRAEKLILPGVGHFKVGMDNLRSRGLIPVLEEKVLVQKTPILGICLGMQLFSRYSEEGNVEGLSWLNAETLEIDSKLADGRSIKVPHMGWNTLELSTDDSTYRGITAEDELYFCHTYHVRCADEQDVRSRTNYGTSLVASVRKDNIYGMQFHPEKSHDAGALLIANFVGREVRDVVKAE